MWNGASTGFGGFVGSVEWSWWVFVGFYTSIFYYPYAPSPHRPPPGPPTSPLTPVPATTRPPHAHRGCRVLAMLHNRRGVGLGGYAPVCERAGGGPELAGGTGGVGWVRSWLPGWAGLRSRLRAGGDDHPSWTVGEGEGCWWGRCK